MGPVPTPDNLRHAGPQHHITNLPIRRYNQRHVWGLSTRRITYATCDLNTIPQYLPIRRDNQRHWPETADYGGRSSADFQFENRIAYATNRSIPTQPSARTCRGDEFPYLDRQKWRPEEGSLNFGLNSVGFLHFPASTGGSGGWDWSGWKEEDGTVLLGPVPPQMVAGCGGGGPKNRRCEQ
ncbi:hypothetical protein L3X38_034092 [Prunus dulcis]|uniref:Uncharacterized protein n=1 Tax=Prunus dulcis TaxID=3755 RepID=A0AAD4VH52_PRUDU|nr:hypothetical protein L3X38_034092 [Prunus dulcis]